MGPARLAKLVKEGKLGWNGERLVWNLGLGAQLGLGLDVAAETAAAALTGTLPSRERQLLMALEETIRLGMARPAESWYKEHERTPAAPGTPEEASHLADYLEACAGPGRWQHGFLSHGMDPFAATVSLTTATPNGYVAIAQNPVSPWFVLQELYEKHRQSEVLRALAQNPNLPPVLYEKMIRAGNRDVLHALALNLNLPEEAGLRLLLKTELWPGLRALVAGRPDIRESWARAAAESPEVSVRVVVARNPRLPQAVRDQLAQDSNPLVAAAARSQMGAEIGL